MLFIFVCIGSSCHLKGSYEMVQKFEAAIARYKLQDEVVLAGSFCLGRCNRRGVTVKINDDVYEGVQVEAFDDFFTEHVLTPLGRKAE